MVKLAANHRRLSSFIYPVVGILVILVVACTPLVAHVVGGLTLAALSTVSILTALYLVRAGVLPPECDVNRTHRRALVVFASIVSLHLASDARVWHVILQVCECLVFSPSRIRALEQCVDPLLSFSCVFLLLHAIWICTRAGSHHR